MARPVALTPLKQAAARQMRRTAADLDRDHPETVAAGHVRDAARVLEHGSTDGAKRHLDAAIELMTPRNLYRHGITDDEGHATAKMHMHEIHRHRLAVQDIEDARARNTRLSEQVRARAGDQEDPRGPGNQTTERDGSGQFPPRAIPPAVQLSGRDRGAVLLGIEGMFNPLEPRNFSGEWVRSGDPSLASMHGARVLGRDKHGVEVEGQYDHYKGTVWQFGYSHPTKVREIMSYRAPRVKNAPEPLAFPGKVPGEHTTFAFPARQEPRSLGLLGKISQAIVGPSNRAIQYSNPLELRGGLSWMHEKRGAHGEWQIGPNDTLEITSKRDVKDISAMFGGVQIHSHRERLAYKALRRKGHSHDKAMAMLRKMHPEVAVTGHALATPLELVGPKGFIHGWIKVAQGALSRAGKAFDKAVSGSEIAKGENLGVMLDGRQVEGITRNGSKIRGKYDHASRTVHPRHSSPQPVSHIRLRSASGGPPLPVKNVTISGRKAPDPFKSGQPVRLRTASGEDLGGGSSFPDWATALRMSRGGWAVTEHLIELASAGGHHVAGTPYTYRHGWMKLDQSGAFAANTEPGSFEHIKAIADLGDRAGLSTGDPSSRSDVMRTALHNVADAVARRDIPAARAHLKSAQWGNRHQANGLYTRELADLSNQLGRVPRRATGFRGEPASPISVKGEHPGKFYEGRAFPPANPTAGATREYAGMSTGAQIADDAGWMIAEHLIDLSARTAMLQVTPAPLGKPGGPGLYGVKGMGHDPYFQQVVKALIEKRGMPKDRAYKIAYGALRRWRRGGGHVHPEVRAAATKTLIAERAKGLEARAIHGHATEGWGVVEGLIELAHGPHFHFNPDQPRDSHGRWTRLGSAGEIISAPRGPAPGRLAPSREARMRVAGQGALSPSAAFLGQQVRARPLPPPAAAAAIARRANNPAAAFLHQPPSSQTAKARYLRREDQLGVLQTAQMAPRAFNAPLPHTGDPITDKALEDALKIRKSVPGAVFPGNTVDEQELTRTTGGILARLERQRQQIAKDFQTSEGRRRLLTLGFHAGFILAGGALTAIAMGTGAGPLLVGAAATSPSLLQELVDWAKKLS